MNDELDAPEFDPLVSHQALGLAQDVRGRVYKLCPQEMEHKERLALACTYTIHALITAACEIAVEYDIPAKIVVRAMASSYQSIACAEEGEIH